MESLYSSFDLEKFALSSLCKRGHDFEGTGQSLRYARADGRPSSCVECERVGREVNLEQKKERDRARYRANSEQVRERTRAYYQGNTGQGRKVRRAWYEANLGRAKEFKRRRNDRKKEAPALLPLTSSQDRQRRQDFNCSCAFCGKPDPMSGKKPPMDHFLPLSFGNALTPGNAVPACHTCNTSKLNADPWEWYSRQAFFSQERWNKILQVLGKEDYRQMTLI